MSDAFWTNFWLAVIALINVLGMLRLAKLNRQTREDVAQVSKNVNGLVNDAIANAEVKGHAVGRLAQMEMQAKPPKGEV